VKLQLAAVKHPPGGGKNKQSNGRMTGRQMTN
jgi:hypothetical protein